MSVTRGPAAVSGRLFAAILLAASGWACRTAPAVPSPTVPAPVLSVPRVDQRALLLLLVDRQIYEGFSVQRALEAGGEMHLELARALGRAGAPQGRVVLERLLADDSEAVRHAAVFALGELGEPLSRVPLLELARGADPVSGRLAVEALAKLGTDLKTVSDTLASLEPGERAARLLPSLFRFDAAARRLPASEWLTEEDPQLHAWAAYALCRGALAESAPLIRSLLSDRDPWIRGWAARALGSIGDGGDLERLRPLLEDAEAGPTIQALRAARRLIRTGAAAPPADWKPELVRLAADGRSGVRITALEAIGAWLLDEELSGLLEWSFDHGSPRERQVALLALAEGGGRHATDLVWRAAASEDLQLRRRAAQAAVEVGADELVSRLFSDPHPAVRAATAEALLESDPDSGSEVAAAALGDGSAAVREVGARWAIDHPELDADRLLGGFRPSSGEDRTELEMRLVEALGARAGFSESERTQILEALERLVLEKGYLVRRAAAGELERLGETPPPIGVASEGRDLATYRDIVQRTAVERWARIETSGGDIVLRLDCPLAPLTCLSFLQLAEQGFYDGLTFHRVVPDFVVQGGDPSGGGWGGPGYTLRDEINRMRYETGVLGMAHSGPDTAGSQFFITLSPQPHLDGGYTAFGQVERGLEVLREIEQEDVILRIREIPGAAASRPAVG